MSTLDNLVIPCHEYNSLRKSVHDKILIFMVTIFVFDKYQEKK